MFRLSFLVFAVAALIAAVAQANPVVTGAERYHLTPGAVQTPEMTAAVAKPGQLAGTGNFMILWKQVGGEWNMAESISYGHKLAE